MSYGIVSIEKYKKFDVRGIQIHMQREKGFSNTNSNINFSKSFLNYDLWNLENINYSEKIKERISQLELSRAVRKDAIVMCQCLIMSDKDFFVKMSENEQIQFFKDSLDFIVHRYGSENIISAVVHNDENVPHIHINFVPVTADGRLCAKDLFKKQDLIRLHDDFYKFNKMHGYDLERGESKGEIQKHLNAEEAKLKKRTEAVNKGFEEVNRQQDRIDAKLKHLDVALDGLDALGDIKVKKGFNDKITLSGADYKRLYDLAQKGLILQSDNDEYNKLMEGLCNLLEENKRLKNKLEYNNLDYEN